MAGKGRGNELFTEILWESFFSDGIIAKVYPIN